MMSNYRVLLDSCVLANHAVTDLLLRLSTFPSIMTPHWTSDILHEVKRTQINKLNWPADLAERFQRALRNHFPDALISGYEPFISLMPNHEKDRHVMAAAYKGRVDAIITFNLKDFRIEQTESFDFEVLHPQEYLESNFLNHPTLVLSRLQDIAQNRSIDVEMVLAKLRPSVPSFVEMVRQFNH
jgi:predicted nucleic acid-binding protein